jgi:uncharacterized membrane protein
MLLSTNLIGIAFSAILVFFSVGIKNTKEIVKWFYTGTVLLSF